MSLADTVRSGVATAKQLLGDGQLLTTVRHAHVTQVPPARDEYGAVARGAAVPRTAVVESSARQFVALNGNVVVATTRVIFLEAVDVHPEDAIELPDGTSPPILLVDQAVLPSTNVPFAVLVYLGPNEGGR